MLDIAREREKETEPYHVIMARDGLSLFLREWKKQDSEYAILMFHGITAHSKPYEFVARPLMDAGFEVYGLDLRGHGLSDGPRGDLPSKEVLLDDLNRVVDFLLGKKKKVILFGHSLGVLTAMLYLSEHPEKIQGAILLSYARKSRPGVYKKPTLGFKLKYLYYSIFNPGKQIVHYYRDGMVGLDDPLFTFWYSPRFLKIYLRTRITFKHDLTIPVFYGIGDQDELFTVDAAREFFEEIPARDKVFNVFPGASHAFFPAESVETIFSWAHNKFL